MSADTDMVDLKPCPFCGGKAEISFYMRGDSKDMAGFYVECGSCSAGGEPFDIQGEAPDREEYTKSKAMAAWNTRAALDASGIGEMVEALQKCRDKFAEYVELHAVKLQGAQPTYAVKEIEAKVARNQAMVDLCDAALSRARATVGNKK